VSRGRINETNLTPLLTMLPCCYLFIHLNCSQPLSIWQINPGLKYFNWMLRIDYFHPAFGISPKKQQLEILRRVWKEPNIVEGKRMQRHRE
jgi:hypothetical protein